MLGYQKNIAITYAKGFFTLIFQEDLWEPNSQTKKPDHRQSECGLLSLVLFSAFYICFIDITPSEPCTDPVPEPILIKPRNIAVQPSGSI